VTPRIVEDVASEFRLEPALSTQEQV